MYPIANTVFLKGRIEKVGNEYYFYPSIGGPAKLMDEVIKDFNHENVTIEIKVIG